MKKKLTKLSLILLLTLIFRLIAINQSFWLDEAINVIAVRDLSLDKLLSQYSVGDFHPPLYHILLWSWFKFFPATEIWARIPSVIFAVATVFFTFKIAKVLVNSERSTVVAAVASTLLATSSLHIYYSQEARMYALAAFLTTYVFYILVKLKDTVSVKNKIGFAAALVLLFLTDYQPWLLLPLFFMHEPLLTSVALLFTTPWWPMLAKQVGVGLTTAQAFPGWETVVGKLTLKTLLLVPVKFLVGRVSIDNSLLFAAVLTIPLLVVGLAMLRFTQKREWNRRLLLGWLLVPLFAGALLAIKIPIFSYFRFLFVLPAFYLVASIGLSSFSPRWKKAAIGVLLVTNLISLAAYLTLPKFHREDWKGATKYLHQFDPLQTLVVFPNLAQSAGLDFYNDGKLKLQDGSSLNLDASFNDVFLVRYVSEIFDPEDKIPNALEEAGFKRIQEIRFQGILIWHYKFEPALV